jgi:ArsR family transcriptional regulator
MDDPLQSTDCAARLKALAEPDRLRLVQLLRSGPKNVGELSALMGKDVANVSHHLGVLRRAGFVRHTKHGKFVVYALHPDVFRPGQATGIFDVIDLGCCELKLTGAAATPDQPSPPQDEEE